MSVETVKEYFKQWDMENRVQEFSVSSATVSAAALALGTEEKRIAKSLSFKLDDHAILVVTAGDAKIDNKKYKEVFHKKAVMLKPDEVLSMIGHAVGGVCPFGISGDVSVYLDESLKRFSTVFPACGSGNSAIELTIPELEKYSNFSRWVDVCKNWENE